MASAKQERIELWHFTFLFWIFFVAISVLWEQLFTSGMPFEELVKTAWMVAVAACVIFYLEKRRRKRERSSKETRSR